MHGHIGIKPLSYLITCIELSYFFDPSRIKLSTNQVSEFLEKLPNDFQPHEVRARLKKMGAVASMNVSVIVVLIRCGLCCPRSSVLSLQSWPASLTRHGRTIPRVCAQAAATAGLTLAPSWPGFVGLFSVWAFNLSMLMPTLLVRARTTVASPSLDQRTQSSATPVRAGLRRRHLTARESRPGAGGAPPGRGLRLLHRAGRARAAGGSVGERRELFAADLGDRGRHAQLALALPAPCAVGGSS